MSSQFHFFTNYNALTLINIKSLKTKFPFMDSFMFQNLYIFTHTRYNTVDNMLFSILK